MMVVLPLNPEESWSFEDTLATLTARFHKKALLDMYVWTDDRDSRRHIIHVRLTVGTNMSVKIEPVLYIHVVVCK